MNVPLDWVKLHPIPGQSAEEIRSISQTIQEFVSGGTTHLLGIDFNVFDWTRQEQIGLFLGMFVRLGLLSNSGSLQDLFAFTNTVANNYYDNPYHSFYHAIDTTYMVFYLIEDMKLSQYVKLANADKVVLLFSALGHDVLHPGTNNIFQVATDAPVALKYNDISVLENQSADFIKSYLLQHRLLTHFCFEDTSANADIIIQRITDCIIKTDMKYHFSSLENIIEIAEFNREESIELELPLSNKTCILTESMQTMSPAKNIPQVISQFRHYERDLTSEDSTKRSNSEIKTIIFPSLGLRETMIQNILHFSDISNAARPFKCCKRWSDLVMQEFFMQGELERAANLAISPNMDPSQTDQQKVQLAFSQLIVQPLFECYMDLFPSTYGLIELIFENTRQWGGSPLYVSPTHRSANFAQLEKDNDEALLRKSVSESVLRRVSSAAGTIDLPDSIEKYFKKQITRSHSVFVGGIAVTLPKRRTDVDINEEDFTESFQDLCK